jgi:hypothetical protein
VLFLMTLRPPRPEELAAMRAGGKEPSVPERYGLLCVRGCEIIEVRDEAGKLMNDFTGGRHDGLVHGRADGPCCLQSAGVPLLLHVATCITHDLCTTWSTAHGFCLLAR